MELQNKNNMEFNSQICTSREQSERLLALGLKKETADMRRPHYDKHCPWVIVKEDCLNEHWLLAWSLHRLFQIYTNGVISSSWNMAKFNWDDLIDCIEDSIVKGHFNKEYLV